MPEAASAHRRSEEGLPPHKPSSLSWDEALAGAGWESWQAHLTARRAPRPLLEAAPAGKTPPLLWSVPERCGPSVLRALQTAGSLHAADRREVLEFAKAIVQETATPRPLDDAVTFGFTRLAWAHALPPLAAAMEAGAWRDLLQHLTSAIDEAAAIAWEQDALGRMLLAGELPWTLAYLFPELDACRRRANAASSVLTEGMAELLDGEGVPAAHYLPVLRPLLAVWTRCGLMAREMRKECLPRAAREQYSWLVQRTILLSRPDGGQLLQCGAEGRWRPELFEAACVLSGDPHDAALAELALPPRGRDGRLSQSSATFAKRKATLRSFRGAKGDYGSPAFHSEWAEVGLLRTEPTRESPRLVVSYANRRLRAELTNYDTVIFSGDWAPQIDVNGQRLAPEGDWEEVCWVSDADLDYLELEMSLTAGWRVQRQMALARKDGFLFVADAVLGLSPATIEYRCPTPLADGVTFAGEEETRDGVLAGKKRLAVVLPLALPEWRIDRRPGSLATAAGGLEFNLIAQGRALFAPLFFDLDRRRFKKERTWRRLTVAERLQIQPPDAAVGYRVQVGAQQWLFYRSLAQAANRTVLGQNLASEFLAARFTAEGYAEELVAVSTE